MWYAGNRSGEKQRYDAGAQVNVDGAMNKTRGPWVRENSAGLRPQVWVVLGFLICYLFFFIAPVFFNSAGTMRFFEYVPVINPIGADLRQTLQQSESWAVHGQDPYVTHNQKPPLSTIVFAPLVVIDFVIAYRIVTVLTLLCYIFNALIFPLLIYRKTQPTAIMMLIFVAGLFSYGLHFEIERGQFDVITVGVSFFSIYLYHRCHRCRYLAYALFSVSVQLKIFPIVYVVMLIKDWTDWKHNIGRVLGIILFNIALLFVMGPKIFASFIRNITPHILEPYTWVGNHSVRSFVTITSMEVMKSFHLQDRELFATCCGLAQILLLGFVAGCIAVPLLQECRRGAKGINSYVLLNCTIAALLIPSVSHDYKLSILAGPVAIALDSDALPRMKNVGVQVMAMVMIGIISLAYWSTMFSYTYKSSFMGNNLPSLIVMLLASTVLSFITRSGCSVRR